MIIFCITTLIIVLIFFVANKLYLQTNYYANKQIDIKQIEQGITGKVSIANIGSTYSKFAFAYSEKLGVNWLDLSFQSQSLEMDKAIISEYIKNVKEGGVVVVVVAACLLLYRERGENELYLDVLEKKDNPTYSRYAVLKKKIPLLFNLKKIVKIFMDDIPASSVYELYPNNMDEKKAREYIDRLVSIWKDLFGLENLRDINLSENNECIIKQNIRHLESILDCCIDNKITPIVVVPPFSNVLNSYFSYEFKEYILNHNICKAIGNRKVLFLDYQFDDYFQNRYELFVDWGFRLNKYGSKVFIKRLLYDLKKYGIIINNKVVGK